MARRGTRGRKAVTFADSHELGRKARDFVESMRIRNFSERTVVSHSYYLSRFIDWAVERSVTRPNEVTKPILERYQRHLFHHRTREDQPLSFRSQHHHLSTVRSFFRWLSRQNHILYNPASELELPKLEKRLPRHVLSASEVERVLVQPDITEPLGIRDRAILEVFYSTGMRRKDLVELLLYSIDVERGTVFIRQGKGKKDRVIPIGERALVWTQKYLDDVRASLVVEPDDGTLFLSAQGESMSPGHVSDFVRRYIDAAELGKTGSCHLFRHSMATLMLENGADIRFIQAILGHAELSTTQIYTQVSIRKLKEIHTATHPARVERTPPAGESGAARDAGAELLASLAAEAAEEDEEHLEV